MACDRSNHRSFSATPNSASAQTVTIKAKAKLESTATEISSTATGALKLQGTQASLKGTGMAAVGIMPREVRIVILSSGLVLAGLLGPTTGVLVLQVALAIIALGATITVIQRILHVRRQSRQHPTQSH